MAALKQRPTWAGFKGSHAVSDALFAARAEADSVAERCSDVGVAKRHHLQHLLDPRLQVSQQLLQCPAYSHLGTNTQQGCASLTDVHVHILRGMKVQVGIEYCIIFYLSGETQITHNSV